MATQAWGSCKGPGDFSPVDRSVEIEAESEYLADAIRGAIAKLQLALIAAEAERPSDARIYMASAAMTLAVEE